MALDGSLMPITDKTRKILWGRSGSRCAMCRRELVEDRTDFDDESVVGDECHIVSGRPEGPRCRPDFPPDRLDSLNNLILLCRIHHKLADDQHETYTVELLQHIKANHEKWVAACLTEEEKVAPVRIRRIKENVPTHLPRLSSGREVMAIVEGACASAMNHDELISDEEVALVGGFLQELRDWGDLGADLEPADRVRETFSLTKTIEELEEAGFMVFGGREIQRLEGGLTSPTNWSVAIIRVVRMTSPEIISVELPEDATTGGTEAQE